MLATLRADFKVNYGSLVAWSTNKETWLVVFLFIGVICSSLSVSYQKHWSRNLNYLYQNSLLESNRLQVEWRQLLVEQRTWSAYSRIASLASSKLNMYIPKLEDVVLVKM